MATELKLRKGTTAEHSTFTGAEAEVTFDTDKNTIVAHDGTTAGGFEAMRADADNAQNDVITNDMLSLNANDSEIKKAINADNAPPIYACRAWVDFDGSGTVSIRESGNVSSITDQGTGQYIINFSTSMPDTKYAAVGSTGASNKHNLVAKYVLSGGIAHDSDSFPVAAFDSGEQDFNDDNAISVAVFR